MGKGKKKKSSDVVLLVLIIMCIAVAGYGAYGLWSYYADYASDRERYDTLRDDVLTVTESSGTEEIANTNEQEADALSVPVSVDWDALAKINEDIIGWVYFTGLTQISYPVLQAEDNSYYLYRTYDLSDSNSKAGSIFMDYRMERDFSSPYTIIYGHNVRDGSMLSDLDKLTDQSLYDQEPYFWIFTPDGDYEYQIFSIFVCERSADVFQMSFDSFDDSSFLWEQELKARNIMQGDTEIAKGDHVIVFSTCVPDSYNRLIVCGRRIG